MSLTCQYCENNNKQWRLISEEGTVFIKFLHQAKSKKAKKFFKEFTNKNWSLSSVKKLRTKIDQTGTVDRKSSSSKKCTARISQNIDSVGELV